MNKKNYFQCFENINEILNTFKFSSKIPNSFDFLSCDLIFSSKILFPEIWKNKNFKFNRSQIFYEQPNKKTKFYNKNNFNIFDENNFYFPLKEFNISNSNSDLFKNIDEFNKTNNDFNENESVFFKTWKIFTLQNQHIQNFGPYPTETIFIFLKEIFTKMTDEEKNKKFVLIEDVKKNVHYKPELLLDILNKEYEIKFKNENKKIVKSKENKKNNFFSQKKYFYHKNNNFYNYKYNNNYNYNK
jgi:hypothetical protein